MNAGVSPLLADTDEERAHSNQARDWLSRRHLPKPGIARCLCRPPQMDQVQPTRSAWRYFKPKDQQCA